MTSVEITKKYIPIGLMILFVIVCILFLVFPPNGKLVCNANGVPGDVEIKYSYVAEYKWWVVKKLSVKQTISAKDDEILDNYKKILENDFKLFNNVKSVKSNIEMIDTSLVGTFNIDYENLNTDGSNNSSSLLKNKNMFVGSLKKRYKKNGATCKYN